jgi:hypothetical protein
MFMKIFMETVTTTFVSFALLTFSGQSHALAADQTLIKNIMGAQHTRHKLDQQPPMPVRQAKFQVILKKYYNKKQLDGSFKGTVEDICTIDAQISVYDFPQGTVPNPDMGHSFTCKTQLMVGPSTISVNGVIEILRGLQSPFPGGGVIDWKIFDSYFSVVSDDGKFSSTGYDSVSISEDLTHKTEIQSSDSAKMVNSANPSQALDELILMAVRIED